MKRIYLLVAAFVLTFSTAYSAPVDIPSALKNVEGRNRGNENQPVSFSVSGEGEYLSKRDLRISGLGAGDNKNKVSGQFYTGKGKFSFGGPIGNWDLYGFAGVGENLKIKDISSGGSSFDLEYKDNMLQWGGGANWLIMYAPEYYGFGVFVDGKYRQLENFKIDKVKVNGVDTPFTSNSDPRWQEWQGAAGIAGKIKYFVPFGGVTYSDTRIKTDVTTGSGSLAFKQGDVRNDKRWGGFAGVSFVPNDYISLDVQARFIDEEAYTAQLSLKF